MQAKFVGRWVPNGNNMTTGYPGSSFSFRVSGTSYVNVSISGATRIAYKVDNEAYVVTNNVQITGLTLSTHKIKIVMTTSIQTWAGNNYAQVTGIEVASGGSIIIEPATKRKCLVFGDSITEGWNITAENKTTSELTWCNKLSDMLNMDITPVGIGGIGFTNASNTYPSVKSVPSYIENITSSSVVSNTDYDLVIIELGTNDWKSKTEVDNDYVAVVTACVNRIKAKYPNADIHAMIPFNFNGQPSLNQAYGNTNVNIIPTSWYPSITFADDLHPNNAGTATIATNVKSYLISKYGESYFKEVTMKRIDTVYIDTNGAVQKVTGTMADNPVKPILPSGAIRVADIVVEQGASTGTVVDNRDWLKVYDNLNIVNVKDYGAKGDGSIDDTAAIQSAIDNNLGSEIFFPQGTYLISSPITTSSTETEKCLLRLDHATIKAATNFPTAANTYMINIGSDGIGSAGAVQYHKSGIIGGIIDGSGIAYGGVMIQRQSDAILRLTHIRDVNVIGVDVEPDGIGGSSGARIEDIVIRGKWGDNSVAMLLNGYDNKIHRVGTWRFNTGVKANGGGSFLSNVHVLGWNGSTSAIGFDINGPDVVLDTCYADGYATCIQLGSSAARTVIDKFFAFYGTYDSGIDNYFIKNLASIASFTANNTRCLFNDSASGANIGYSGSLTVNNFLPSCFSHCYFTRHTNKLDLAITSEIVSTSNMVIMEKTDDFNKLRANGSYLVGGSVVTSENQTYHRPKGVGVSHSKLVVNSRPNGYGGWGYCEQWLHTITDRLFFRAVFSDNLETASWGAWKEITMTSL